MNFGKNAKTNPVETAAKPARTETQKAAGRRAIKNGAYATALAVVLLVVIILVNLVVGKLPTKYTQYDISTSGLFTLSDTTKTMLTGMTKDVTAYYLAETGSEDANITRMLDRYAGESGHFTWQQRDPAIYPTFAQQYDAADATSGSVILVCGDKHTLVDYNDMYQADYSDYYTTGSYSMSFNAESSLTSGIAKVISDTAYTLYQLTGHGETALDISFTTTLSNANVTVSDLNLLTAGEIPADAGSLLINCPQVDYTTENIDTIKAFLAKGGKLLVTTAIDYDTPNLDALLAAYGMSRQPGLLIENDTSAYAYRYPQTYLLPTIASNEITSGITKGMYVFAPVSQGILKNEEDENLTLTTLLSTSASSYAMQDYATAETAQQGPNDPDGAFDLAVAAENKTDNSAVTWIACGNVFTASSDKSVSGGNSQLLGSIINWMNGQENGVVIDAKSMSATTLTVPSGAIMGFGLLLVLALPIACIVVGIVLFAVRRRK